MISAWLGGAAVVQLLVDHQRGTGLGEQAGDGARPDLAAPGGPAQRGRDRVQPRLEQGLDDRLGGLGMPVALQHHLHDERVQRPADRFGHGPGHLGQHRDEIRAQFPRIDLFLFPAGRLIREDVDEHLLLVRPAPVQRGLAGAGPAGHALHTQPAVAGLGELGEDGLADLGFELLAAAALPYPFPGHRNVRQIRDVCVFSSARVDAYQGRTRIATGVVVVACEPSLLVYRLDDPATGDTDCWLTWQLDESEPDLTRVTLTADTLPSDPAIDAVRLVSSLKTHVETNHRRNAPADPGALARSPSGNL
jgi:hypothetical protein